MSVMDILVELYFDQMNISPENMEDPNRDLFGMSKGYSIPEYHDSVIPFYILFTIKYNIADTEMCSEKFLSGKCLHKDISFYISGAYRRIPWENH